MKLYESNSWKLGLIIIVYFMLRKCYHQINGFCHGDDAVCKDLFMTILRV